MLATFVIGLREGLEAALIVGIIAAFLRRNGRSLAAMWWGVGAALVLSVAVGTTLWLVEAALPQAAQEGMETVIGAAAVVFVTGMVLWMNRHGRTMKKEIEASASEALGTGTTRALAVMAFLAVLKEGFETSVFLLATFRAAGSATAAAGGAVLGIAAAVVVGIGIYAGGVHLNLARFFRVTGAFLLLVAAGLVLTAVRTAHEAGWLNGGQQRTVDLAWLAPPGSVQAALVTGVLGIPADPRLIEVVAWLVYLVPVALLVYWPARRRPAGVAATRVRLAAAAALAGTAATLAIVAPLALTASSTSGTIALTGGGTARLDGDHLVVAGARIALPAHTTTVQHLGLTAQQATVSGAAPSPGAASITLQQLTADNGGRIPVGLNPAVAPGPYRLATAPSVVTTAWSAGGRLLDVQRTETVVGVLTGGGLTGSRTVTLRSSTLAGTPASTAAAARSVVTAGTAAPERVLWGVQVPLALLVAAVFVALGARRRRAASTDQASFAPPRTTRSSTYAVR